MSDDLSLELAELTADLKAVLLDARARGIRSIPIFEGERAGVPGSGAAPGEHLRQPQSARSLPVDSPGVAPVSSHAGPLDAKASPVPQSAPVGPSRLFGTDSKPLLEIRTEMGECVRCGLCEGRNHLVFGTGHPDADLLIVGEAPGAQEDRRGLPFVGPAGKMLDNMLKHVLGLDRESVYITNVVKCRPPNNRTPEPAEISMCNSFLERQIRAIGPKVILALGRPAAQTLLQTTAGITSLRGSWGQVGDVPVLPTFHPAYLLRKPQEKRIVFSDLQQLRERYDALGGRR